MTKSKRMIIRLLCVILLLGLLPCAAISAYNNEEGEALTWSYDAQTQTLTISGTEPMNDFGTFQHYYGEGNLNVKKLTNAPWYIYYSETKTVVMEPGVTTVGKNAFYGFDKLTAVTIPDTVTRIGQAAFYDCSALTDLVIPGSVSEIGREAFRGGKSLTAVVIPDSVTSIGEGAFSYCFGLREAVLSNNLNDIPASAFRYCAALERITIPDSATVIGDYAFSECKGLKTVVWGDHVEEIGNNAFHLCISLTNITVPDSIKKIGKGAFCDCTGLQRVTLPNGMTDLPRMLFENCMSLTRIEIPDSVTDIGSSAFFGCAGLMSIAIPDSVTDIGSSAFFGCSGLTSITIPDSVTNIGNSAFSGCTGLTHITIPGNVTSIGNFAFDGCNGLTSVTVCNSVKSIGYYAFSYCTALKSITIPDSVETIGRSAFTHSALTQVTLPDGLSEIAVGAFSYCAALESITIPGSVTSIGNTAFQTCTGLTDVYFHGTRAEWQTIQIGNNNQPLLCARIHCLGEIYTAAFVVDGEVYATETFTATQESILEPDIPEKPGYTGAWSPYILNEQDIAIEAIYEPITYYATFVADVKQVGEKIPFTVLTESITPPDVPEKTGYSGVWQPFTLGTADLTVEAVYSQITYYATIIADGATIAKIPFVYGQKSITLPDVPKKEGHTGAWPTYTLPAHDITIEAVYTPIEYTITYLVDEQSIGSSTIPYGGPIWQPRIPQKEGYTFTGWTPAVPDTMPAEDLTFTAVFEPVTYYVTFMADGKQIGEKLPFTVLTESVTPPAVPEKPGYAGAWEDFTLGIGDLTVSAVYTKLPTVTIKNYTATKSVDYKATVTFTAVTENAPADATIQWFVSDKKAETGATCTVKQATADYTVQAKLIGGDGSVLAESETETVKVNTGFFAKLIAFFKGLFGSLPVITQAIKETL
ncbi:MAG: leucine-rich repeat protein [Clostridia bacterium]|nr:leucine-rich repeat protein [Clostridia bacterium]